MEEFDDFAMVTQLTRRELVHVLESIAGAKEVVVEQSLMRPLDKVARMSLLQEHGCTRVHQLAFDGGVVWSPDAGNRVFLVRPSIKAVRKVCELVRADPHGAKYAAVFVDRMTNVCGLELERHGVSGLVECFELNLSFIPLESDLFSLELPQDVPRSSRTDIQAMAKCLWQLQSLYGSIPTCFGLGKDADACYRAMQSIAADFGEPPATADQPISHLFLFDRKVDVASCFLTGLTYESLLNDVFSYSCGKISFGDAVETKLKQKSNSRRVIALNNSDVIFSTVRNRYISAVFPFLSAKAKTLQESFDRAAAMNRVDEVKDFVSNKLRSLKQEHKLLELHICACEVILETNRGAGERFALEHAIVRRDHDPDAVMAHLEESICRQQDPWQVLQLACLWSVTDDGIPTRHFALFRRLFLQASGYDFIPVFHYLQTAGLLVEKAHSTPKLPFKRQASIASPREGPTALVTPPSRTSTFATVSKVLQLAENESGDAKAASKPAYVFGNAYTPVICQLLSLTTSEGWPATKLGKAFAEDTPFFSVPPKNPPKPDNRIRKALLVAFIGGVTFAEVAALRQFAQDRNFRIIMVASHVIHRQDYLKSFVQVLF